MLDNYRYCSKLVVIFHVILSVFAVFLLANSFVAETLNRCEMTYMYRMPQYIDIRLSKKTHESFPKYALWLYTEQDYIDTSRLRGIPVLFIPGNAGSGKQARSLGSVVLAKAESMNPPSPQFDVFGVDFDEELCGIYGPYLWQQTKFVQLVIRQIFRLYSHLPTTNRPTQIVLVGHSMGGMVARGLLTLADFSPESVSAVITLGTPHRRPPISFDTDLLEYMDVVNGWWAAQANTNLSHLTAVSIGAGVLDGMVSPELTLWPDTLREYVYTDEPTSLLLLEQLSPALQYVWTSMDHLCIVWCNQLVRVTTRVLFDGIDTERRQFSTDQFLRRSIFKWHFKNNRGFKSIFASEFSMPPANYSSVAATSNTNRVYVSSVHKPLSLYRLTIRPSLMGQTLFLLTNQRSDDFVRFCDSPDNCQPITTYEFLPPELRAITIDIDAKMIGKAFILSLRHHESKRLLVQRLFNATLRRFETDMGVGFSNNPWRSKMINFKGTDGYASVTLNGFRRISQAFTVALRASRCGAYEDGLPASLWFQVPGHPMLSLYRSFRYPYDSSDDLNTIFHAVPIKPLTQHPVLHLFFNPACDYQLLIRPNLLASFKQIVTHFAYLLPSLVVFFTLLLMSSHDLIPTVDLCSSAFLLCHFVGFLMIFLRCILSSDIGADHLASFLLCLITVGVVQFGCLLSFGLVWVTRIFIRLITRTPPKADDSKSAFTSVILVRCSLALLLACLLIGCCGFVAVAVSFIFALRCVAIAEHKTAKATLVMFAHILLLVMLLPSAVIWIVELKRSRWFLSVDPSAHAAWILIALLSLPIPSTLQSVRWLLVLALGVGALTENGHLPISTLAVLVAAAVALHLNCCLVWRSAVSAVTDTAEDTTMTDEQGSTVSTDDGDTADRLTGNRQQ